LIKINSASVIIEVKMYQTVSTTIMLSRYVFKTLNKLHKI